MSEPEVMEAEFDTIAAWTEQVVRDLGPEYAIPASCRGSGSPSWLGWLADRLRPEPGQGFIDAGAGLGGPAAWLRERHEVAPTLIEPMVHACQGARRLFGLPTAAAWSERLPFRAGTFDVGWLLGVLCTTPDHGALLRELRRVFSTGGRLGLLVLVQLAGDLSQPPEGNHFPTGPSLHSELESAGFRIDDEIVSSQLPPADAHWDERVRQVEEALQRRCGTQPAWLEAHEQETRIGRLMREGDIETRLLHVTATRPAARR